MCPVAATSPVPAGPAGLTDTRRRHAGMPSVTVPEIGAGPQATLSLTTVVSPGAGATKPGDKYTATGRLPAGAGPLPCSQYLVNTGWAGSGAGCEAGTLG